jgi:hypothetical protein
MDDIEAIMKAAKEMPDEIGGKPFLNPLSALPSSKHRLKLAIKERIRLLYAAYISLASFVPDEEIDELTGSKRQRKDIRRVLKEMEQNRREIDAFRPLELSTPKGLDSKKGRRH